ncbi:hypothetical protein N431DRAFT_493580 [Stipitochalara longipes BDJ]|nr:hypothetical protein N431DRAFT_493580 [Stipitochalara longipes BDJ]
MQRDPPRVVKRSQKACTECRQAKVCTNIGPGSTIQRQRTKEHAAEACPIYFHRLIFNSRLNDVTSQLTAIQQTLGRLSSNSGTLPSQAPSANAVSEPSEPHITPLSVVENSYDTSDETFFYRDEHVGNLPATPMSLGQTLIEASQAEILFDHFQKHYYRHCPILHANRTTDSIFRSSPFLFWTIIIISSRFHPTLTQTYQTVVTPYRNLLGKVLAEPITTLESIHGIIMLCIWPLAVDRQPEDSSWNYCGLVTNAAIRMGLHKDGTESNSNRNPIPKTEATIRANTWMACLKVNSIFIWHFVPCLHLGVTNTSSGSLSHFETDFANKLQIGMKSIKAAVFISKIHQHVDISMIHLICEDLDDLKHKNHNTWSEEAEIERLAMCQAQCSPPSSSENTMLKHSLISLGFTAAVRIIYIFSTTSAVKSTLLETQTHKPCQSEEFTRTQRYLPKYYFRTLLFAASFIFKAMANYEETNSSHYEIARNHIRQTYRMLSSWSEDKMDEFGRAARMIEVLSHVSNLSDLKEFDSHGGASLTILEDTVQTAKEIREGLEINAAGNPASQYGTPCSVRADPPSEVLPGTLGPWVNPGSDVVNDFDYDWNLFGEFDMTSSEHWVPGFGAESGDSMFSR